MSGVCGWDTSFRNKSEKNIFFWSTFPIGFAFDLRYEDKGGSQSLTLTWVHLSPWSHLPASLIWIGGWKRPMRQKPMKTHLRSKLKRNPGLIVKKYGCLGCTPSPSCRRLPPPSQHSLPAAPTKGDLWRYWLLLSCQCWSVSSSDRLLQLTIRWLGQ